jgi:hypothetical protein
MGLEQNKNLDAFNRLVEYHMGLLSAGEIELTTRHLQENPELNELSIQAAATIAPLAKFEVEVPTGLESKIKLAVRVQKIDTHTLLRDLTNNEPATAHKRNIFMRWADFIGTAAAILLICSAVTLSTDHTRRQARKALCEGNLGMLGSAISTYANDYYNQLPQASANSSPIWYDSQRQTPKRENLFVLVKRNYAQPEIFACPEDAAKQARLNNLSKYRDFPANTVVSYSFQNLHSDRNFRARQLQLRWQQAPMVVIMADRTPLLRQNRLNPKLTSDNTLSGNHIRLGGQNVLVLDGRVAWQTGPVFGPKQDNIWQAGHIQNYTGTEAPADPVDCFLAP